MLTTYLKHVQKPLDLQYYHQDISLSLLPTNTTANGIEHLSQLFTLFPSLTKLAFSNVRAESMAPWYEKDQPEGLWTKNRVVAEDVIIEELVWWFQFDVEMNWLLPTIKATGQKLTVPLFIVTEFSQNKVIKKRVYWDQMLLLKQLGLVESLPSAGLEIADRLWNERNEKTGNSLTRSLGLWEEREMSSEQLYYVKQQPAKHETVQRKKPTDSIGALFGGDDSATEQSRPSTRVNSKSVGGKSNIFGTDDETQVHRPMYHVDPKRYEDHFVIGDKSSYGQTTLEETTDMRFGKHGKKLEPKKTNTSHFSLSYEDIPEQQPVQKKVEPAFESHLSSNNLVQEEGKVNEEKTGKKFLEKRKDDQTFSIWESSSNGLGSVQSRPSSRVLKQPGGGSTLTFY